MVGTIIINYNRLTGMKTSAFNQPHVASDVIYRNIWRMMQNHLRSLEEISISHIYFSEIRKNIL